MEPLNIRFYRAANSYGQNLNKKSKNFVIDQWLRMMDKMTTIGGKEQQSP